MKRGDGLEMTFVGSYPRVEDMPKDDLPEVALWGRSNVGKSSLINLLAGRKEIARVSGQPGKTRLLNLFVIPGKVRLVDLPGFGYAKVSKADRKAFEEMTVQYLEGSPQLKAVLLLRDLSIAPQDSDLDRMLALAHAEIPVHQIFTKADRLSPTARKAQIKRFIAHNIAEIAYDFPRVVASSRTGIGALEVRQLIEGFATDTDETPPTAQ